MSAETPPRRIQLRRTPGWRKPVGAVVVARPSRWGNPFRIERDECDAPAGGLCWTVTDGRIERVHIGTETEARETAVEFYELHTGPMGDHELDPAEVRAALAGRDLCCWCPLDQPCHADVLLAIANPKGDLT